MQTMTWSSEDIQRDFADAQSLDEIIKAIEADFWSQGEVICEVRVNGMFLDEQDEHRFAGSTVDEISELKVLSRRPDDLVDESLASAIQWIPKVKEAALEVSELFRAGDEQKAQVLFSEIASGCQWLSEALGLLKSVLIQRAQSESFASGWASCESSFASSVGELIDAYQARDLVLLSDILEYDITSSLDQWLALLSDSPANDNVPD